MLCKVCSTRCHRQKVFHSDVRPRMRYTLYVNTSRFIYSPLPPEKQDSLKEGQGMLHISLDVLESRE